mmetsp:Transcript_44213/g.117124  ORF Transcript_44213/g.117124 Transcript_44213/m.117124 type:complete len:496 (-) Transcript_44213:516-2003(-)
MSESPPKFAECVFTVVQGTECSEDAELAAVAEEDARTQPTTVELSEVPDEPLDTADPEGASPETAATVDSPAATWHATSFHETDEIQNPLNLPEEADVSRAEDGETKDPVISASEPELASSTKEVENFRTSVAAEFHDPSKLLSPPEKGDFIKTLDDEETTESTNAPLSQAFSSDIAAWAHPNDWDDDSWTWHSVVPAAEEKPATTGEGDITSPFAMPLPQRLESLDFTVFPVLAPPTGLERLASLDLSEFPVVGGRVSSELSGGDGAVAVHKIPRSHSIAEAPESLCVDFLPMPRSSMSPILTSDHRPASLAEPVVVVSREFDAVTSGSAQHSAHVADVPEKVCDDTLGLLLDDDSAHPPLMAWGLARPGFSEDIDGGSECEAEYKSPRISRMCETPREGHDFSDSPAKPTLFLSEPSTCVPTPQEVEQEAVASPLPDREEASPHVRSWGMLCCPSPGTQEVEVGYEDGQFRDVEMRRLPKASRKKKSWLGPWC